MAAMETGERNATRVLLIVSQSSPHWSRSWDSTEDILPTALEALRESQLVGREDMDVSPRLLVKQKWHLRVLIVFDLFNNDYEIKLGHLPEHNKLPVLVVHFSRKGVSALAANLGMQKRVNRVTADAHNVNGEEGVPPYVVDHTTTVPLYLNPRDPSLL